MNPPNRANDAAGSHGNNADSDQSDQWTTDVFPASDIFEPLVQPTRKNTNKPKFPVGFSPFHDRRDPEADPSAYLPRLRKPFGETIGGASNYIRTHSLSALSLVRRPARIRTVLRALAFMFGALIMAITLWVAAFDFWRHCNGWLHYLFYYVAGTQGYYQRQFKCSRVLREGSNRRFTVTQQFWFRRGCEGSLDGYDKQDMLFKTISDRLVGTFMTTLLCWPRSILRFVIWLLLAWGFIAGLLHDFLYFIAKYAIWLWKKRVWSLVKDFCDWPWLAGFFMIPWIIKAEYFWTAIWAVFLGFDIHAFRPGQGMGQQEGLPVEDLDEMFGPEGEDDGAFPDPGGLNIPEILRPGFVPQFDPNEVFVPGPLEQGPFAPGAPEQGVAMDPDELFFGGGEVPRWQLDPGPFGQFEQEQDDHEDEQRPVARIPVSDNDEDDQGQPRAPPSELVSDSNSVPADLLREPSSEGSYRGGEDLDPERTRTDLAGWNFGHGGEGFQQGGQQQEEG